MAINRDALKGEIDPRLDYLYNKNVRCPYCHAKILKYTSTCTRCGVHKRQIFEASNIRAKEIMRAKTGEKIFMTRRRPNDVSFTRMAILLIFGLFGAHCFYAGRRIRGYFLMSCMIVGLVGFTLSEFILPHSVINIFTDANLPFPTDVLLGVAFVCWAYDVFAVVFGFFKYPIRLGDSVKPVRTLDPIKKNASKRFAEKYGKK